MESITDRQLIEKRASKLFLDICDLMYKIPTHQLNEIYNKYDKNYISLKNDYDIFSKVIVLLYSLDAHELHDIYVMYS